MALSTPYSHESCARTVLAGMRDYVDRALHRMYHVITEQYYGAGIYVCTFEIELLDELP